MKPYSGEAQAFALASGANYTGLKHMLYSRLHMARILWLLAVLYSTLLYMAAERWDSERVVSVQAMLRVSSEKMAFYHVGGTWVHGYRESLTCA